MKTCRCKGAITVFLSLISVLFLSLLCTTIESARIQGARAKAAAALDMGLFSVFGEFENEVLEKYDVFFLDGACGNGTYSQKKLEEKLQTYVEYNSDPNKEILLKGYDPFPLELKKLQITGVTLATDQKGNAFYQQAVGFMHENLATEALSVWMERGKEAKGLEQAEKQYQEKEKKNDTRLKTLQQKQEEQKQQEEQKRKEEREKQENLPAETEREKEEFPVTKNPLEIIKQIRKKGLLGLVLGEKEQLISDKVLTSDVPSKRSCRQGSLKTEKKYSGGTSDILFQEYLFERFPSYARKEKMEQRMDYGLEYILCGQNSDKKNLKSVAKRLLALREGANFFYLSSDPARKAEADALAALITGAIPVPGLQVATSYALLLVWAYAESLLDLRCLFAGGKVPVWKTMESWRLDLQKIPSILEQLESPGGLDGSGLDYEGYLQILFTMGKKSAYSMRTLDLLEGVILKNTDNIKFRVDQAIVKMEAEAEYLIRPIFLKITNTFLGTGNRKWNYHIKGGFAY